jgi:FkbM family methyltransferase
MKRLIAKTIKNQIAKRGFQLSRPIFHGDCSIDLRELLYLRALTIKESTNFNVVQIGANDGSTNDPIHHLVKKYNWRLLAVEPLPEPFKSLEKVYVDFASVTAVNAAVSNNDGEMTLYTLKPLAGREMDSHLASFSLDVLRKNFISVPNLEARIQEIRVPSLSFKTLLTKYEFEDIDFLQVDTEGFDWDVIKMAFDSNIIPKILAFEWTHLGKDKMWDCRCALVERGYQWLIDKGDVIAVQNSLLP